jgi:hypothetical protein
MKRNRMRRPASSVKKESGFEDRWKNRQLSQNERDRDKASKQTKRVPKDKDKSILKSPKLKTLGRKNK